MTKTTMIVNGNGHKGTSFSRRAVPGRGDDLDASGILAMDREAQLSWVHEILLGLGPLEKEAAIHAAADSLKFLGLADFEELKRGGDLYGALERALDAGIKLGRFDRPKRGQIRAIRPDPKDYTQDDWKLCLSNVLDHEPTARDAALRFAAYWAASHMGLTFSRLREGGPILAGLDAALRGAIEHGEMIDAGSGCVRKP
jgi:hypothetical protein